MTMMISMQHEGYTSGSTFGALGMKYFLIPTEDHQQDNGAVRYVSFI